MKSRAARTAFDQLRSYLPRRRRVQMFYIAVFALAAAGVFQAVKQYRETSYVNQMAQKVSAQAGTKDTKTTIVALRDYLRQNVRREHFPPQGRPFLRNTAAETLRSGKGRCGESTRAFIIMADALGIRAQRLYLEGRRRHVVALATLDTGEQVIVDSSDRPYFRDLESLSQLSKHPEFDSYSSFNQRRTFVSLPLRAVHIGRFATFVENPHTLQAALWFFLAAGLVGLKLVRLPLRALRERRKKVVRVLQNDWEATPAPSEVL
jgi:Transglutaminase-like superfamily